MLSLQFTATPAQAPPLQTSPLVQAVPSVHVTAFGALTQAWLTASQLSSVHRLASLQRFGAPLVQTPVLLHPSPTVQTLLSLQGVPSATNVPLQALLLQTSPVVQTFPSLQGAPLARVTWVQLPVTLSQASVVQALASSQFFGEPPTHALLAHASTVVHGLPSSQVSVVATYKQPLEQLSNVHGLLSLHGLLPKQAPPLHASAVVQAMPSLQEDPSVRLACKQPLTASQVSNVQAFLSSQLSEPDVLHRPLPSQASPVVQTLASVHVAATGMLVCLQPTTMSQKSVVHPLASSQLAAGPAAHLPVAHLSGVVQALPSEQEVPSTTAALIQPLAPQESVVQVFLSSQLPLLALVHAPL